jgi:hypothetical protein
MFHLVLSDICYTFLDLVLINLLDINLNKLNNEKKCIPSAFNINYVK